jgi:pimeloyl-ACP methyl ester carboxylesterase
MFITVGDAKIFTTAFGPLAAPPILGIGGWIGSWELWAEPFSILSATWRTISYDHRGSGATVALGAALKYPQRISGLVIVDGFYSRGVADENDPFLAGLRSDYARTLDRFVEACVPEKDCEHIKRWGRQILDRASPEAAIALYRVPGSVDLRDDLHRLVQPALIIHGSADALVSLDSSEWLARTLPNSRLTVLDGAGHVPTMTRPREVAQEIDRFFGS